MPTKTLANLRDALSIIVGDYLHSTVTTALAASTSIVDTLLANQTGGTTNDYFNRWWAFITSQNNSGASRLISDYVASTKTLTVQGANFTSDAAALATYELHRHEPAIKARAINIAARNIGNVYRSILDYTLISGNALPNAHFEDWNSSSFPDFYSVSGATAAKTSTAGLHRGGTNSAKVTASVADGAMLLNSNDYSRLLDLQGQTIDFYVWAYPEVANDAIMEVYTQKADGTEQNLRTTTTCPATKWTRLGLTNQILNDDLVNLQVRFHVVTDTKYVYFDDARVVGMPLHHYLLPQSLQDGDVKRVRLQLTSSDDDNACNDIGNESTYAELTDWRTVTEGQYKYLRTDTSLPQSRRIELYGTSPLEHDATADTDAFTINDPQMDLLVAMSAMEMFGILMGQVTSDTREEYRNQYFFWERRAKQLKGEVGLMKPSARMRFTPYG